METGLHPNQGSSLLVVRVQYGFLTRHGFNAACGIVRQPLYHNLPVMR
jgi:hypothetical protein